MASDPRECQRAHGPLQPLRQSQEKKEEERIRFERMDSSRQTRKMTIATAGS